MLRPAMSQILKEGESYYGFVVAVAKKAREIAEYADENSITLDRKPVTLSVEEFASGKIKMKDQVEMISENERR